MKAVAVYPGKPNSVHLETLPKPSLGEISNGHGELVKDRKVGVDATDREINDALYGNAPSGFEFLVFGHEDQHRFERGRRVMRPAGDATRY